MLCGDQKRVGHSEHAAESQRKSTGQLGHLFFDDVIVFQLILQGVASLSFTTRPSALVAKDRKLSIKVSVVFAPM